MTTRNMNIYKFTKRQLPEVNKKVRRMCVCLGGGEAVINEGTTVNGKK